MTTRIHARIGTIRQLEILLALHDHGSVGAAAKALFLTQPTVSIQLKKLSDALGAPLYDVVGRKIQFTEEGLALVETAIDVLDSFSRLENTLSEMKSLTAGTLRLSVVNTSQYFIPHLLGPFCAKYPGIDVQLNVGNRDQTIERLKKGVDDFYVFSHPPTDPNMRSIEFLDNPLVAIAPNEHPLAHQKSISLQDLAAQPFLMREQGSGTRYAIEAFMRDAGLSLDVKMTIESNEAIKHSVMSGLGVSILSAHTLTYGGSVGLSRLNVPELNINSHRFFVWSKLRRPRLIAEAFLSYVENEGRDVLNRELRQTGINL